LQKKLSYQPHLSKHLWSFLLKRGRVAIAAPRSIVFPSLLLLGITWRLPSPSVPLDLAFFYDRGCRDSLDTVVEVLRVGYVAVPRPRERRDRIQEGFCRRPGVDKRLSLTLWRGAARRRRDEERTVWR